MACVVILDFVVDEGEVVHEFHGDSAWNRSRRIPEESAAVQTECRANAFARGVGRASGFVFPTHDITCGRSERRPLDADSAAERRLKCSEMGGE